MKKMKKFSFVFLVLALVILWVNTGCEKDDQGENPPELPPQEALVMDFSGFNDANDTLDKALATYQNWGHSFATVSVWNVIITVGMAVPVTAYLEAFKHQPEYLGENTWKWSYTYTINNSTFTANLQTKRISNEEFTAEMYISKTGIGAYEDFKWFEGTIRFDRTHAEWTLYESPANPNALLSIEWNKNWETGDADITYTNIKPGAVENGSYIQYAITSDATFDASYTLSAAERLIEIEWNRTSKEGRVKDPVKFGDSDWHCWNAQLQDVDCQ